MSYISFSVTRKDLENYYTPKKDVYDLMTQSINSNGYGQAIYNFISTDDNSINSVNIYNSDRGDMRIYVPSTDTWYSQSEAGPILWDVTSQEGLDFLNGTFSIRGLAKLKYCNTCQDGNGLQTTTIQSFSSRFESLTEMMNDDLVDTGFLFYDYNLSRYQNYYPSVYSTNIGGYKFRNWQKSPKTEIQVAEETAIRPVDITASLDSAEPIKPVTNSSSTIIDCCGLGLKYIINGVYEIGSAVYTKTDVSAICFQVVGNGTDKPDNFDQYSPYRGGCRDCTSSYPCSKK
jgi:hypothetical protein